MLKLYNPFSDNFVEYLNIDILGRDDEDKRIPVKGNGSQFREQVKKFHHSYVMVINCLVIGPMCNYSIS